MLTSLALGSNARTLLDGRWVDVALIVMGALAWFATPLIAMRLVTEWPEPVRVGIALASVLLACGAVVPVARFLRGYLPALRAFTIACPLWTLVVLGLVLRIVWVWAFPAVPASDGQTYLSLAIKLVEGDDYQAAGTRAFWPPGLPFFLSGWIHLLGEGRQAWLTGNLFLYLVSAYGVARVVQVLASRDAAKLAVLLVALWPNLIALCAVPNKELLVVALLPWTSWTVLNAVKCTGALVALAFGGALLGFGILTQPSLQLLLPLLALFLLLGMRSVRTSLPSIAAFVIGAVLVVAPWTLRNYQEFGQFVLVSTNAGSTLYRANNPMATGGYTPRGEISLSGLAELDVDREGKRLASEWIRNNPASFVRLGIEKQIRFMGDDSTGVYYSLKAGKATDSTLVFAAMKAFANAWWLAMWLLLAAAVLVRADVGAALPIYSRFPAWLWLYLFALHSVFESSGKYHMPALWALPVLIAVYLLGPAATAEERNGSLTS